MILAIGGCEEARAGQTQDDLPSVAQSAIVNQYRKCLRYQERGRDGSPNALEQLSPDPTPLPLIASFARVVAFCEPERVAATSSVRIAIRDRHPDWPSQRIAEGAEKKLETVYDDREKRAMFLSGLNTIIDASN